MPRRRSQHETDHPHRLQNGIGERIAIQSRRDVIVDHIGENGHR